MQRGNDCAVREWELPFAKGFYCNVIAQLGAQLLEFVSRQLLDRDQAPVAVTCGNFDPVDWGGVSVTLSQRGSHVENAVGHRSGSSRQTSDAFHWVLHRGSGTSRISALCQTQRSQAVIPA